MSASTSAKPATAETVNGLQRDDRPNFLNQIAALKPDDAAASAEAMKAKHAAADPALIPDDLSIPPYLRRTAEATS